MSDESRTAEARARQRTQSKRATIEALRAKEPTREEFDAPLGAKGERLSFLFVAIGGKEYDALITKHPAKQDQLAKGAAFNIDTFGPELLHKVCAEPKLSAQEWTEIWNDPAWSTGEISDLYTKAVMLCQQGLDTTPIAAG